MTNIYAVTISDGGTTVEQVIVATSIEEAVELMESQMSDAESAYDDEYQRTKWDGAIIDGTALYRLHDGGSDSSSAARVTIQAA